MKRNAGRVALVLVPVVIAGLLLSVGSASPNPAGPTTTIVGCSGQPTPPPPPPDQRLGCIVFVGDADPGVDPPPTGTVGFFLDAINTPSFLGSCTLNSAEGPGGVSFCGRGIPAIPPGSHTIWALYFGGPPYSASVGSDDVGNPPAGPPEATDTKTLCAPTTPSGVGGPLHCEAIVADDDADPDTVLTGTVGFFRDAINTPGFVGSCPLVPVGPALGLAFCEEATVTSPVPPGPSTMWALYFGDAVYSASVGADPITV